MKIKKKTLWLIIGIVIASLFGYAVYHLAQHPVVRSYCVRWSSLDRIAPNVFVDPGMVQTDRDFLLSAIEEGKDRISRLYGDCQAEPIIIAGHTMDVMVKFGGNNYSRAGRAYQTVLGAYIILGPNGISSVDIIAHEIAHADLAARLGNKAANNLPDWFAEGLVLQMDERFTEEDWLARTNNGETAPSLDDITSITHDDWLAYATAKHIISDWLSNVGQEGLLECIDSILQDGDISNCSLYDG